MAHPARTTPKTQLKEDLFVASIVAGNTVTKAAIDAGYSEKSASSLGSQLMSRPRVIAAIQRAKVRVARKFKVTAERLVEEMAIIGLSDIRHYAIAADGYVGLAEGAPDAAMRAVKRIRRKARVIPRPGGASIIEYDTELELWSKDGQLRNLGEYLKLFKENRAEDDEEELTVEQRKERIIAILRVAAKRKAAAGKAG